MSALNRFGFFLFPGVLQSVLSVILLPVSTYVLGPPDFGAFALISAITTFLAIFGSLGVGYVLAANYTTLDLSQLGRLVSTLVWTALSIGVVLAALLIIGWNEFASFYPELRTIPPDCVWLAAAAMVLSLPWTIAIEIIRLDGRAYWYAGVGTVQALSSALALVLGLFYFNLGLVALFASATVGALVMFVGAYLKLRRFLSAPFDRRWLIEILRVGIFTVIANLAESLHQLIEKNFLTIQSGLSQLGLYSHSQQYRSIASMPVGAVANSVWRISLEDAKSNDKAFLRTRIAWNGAQLLLTAAGVGMATLGSYLVAFLTHDKFTAAYVLATLWIVYLMIQNTGKPQTALFYAFGKGANYARIQTISMIVGTLLLLVLVPTFGIYGALYAAFSQQLTMRIAIQVMARQIAVSPFQDQWAIAGASLVLFALWASRSFSTGLLWDASLFVGALLFLGIPAYSVLNNLLPLLGRIRHGG